MYFCLLKSKFINTGMPTVSGVLVAKTLSYFLFKSNMLEKNENLINENILLNVPNSFK